MSSRKQRFTAWGIYTVGSYLILLIGFSWKVSIPIAIITGFLFGLFNEIIHLLTEIYISMRGQDDNNDEHEETIS